MTSTEVSLTSGTLALAPGQTEFTEAQVAVLKTIGVAGASPADLQAFAHICSRLQLDPFARQIYFLERRTKNQQQQWVSKWTPQVGIDGFRLVGRRVAEAAGETLAPGAVEWCDDQGQWTDVWLAPKPPAAARVTIVRGGIPWTGTVIWTEYVPTKDGKPTGQWAVKPAHMLAKCAEALAYRKAFPQDLSGVYAPEEMAQSEQPVKVTATRSTEAVDKALGIIDAPADQQPEIAPVDVDPMDQLIAGATTQAELEDVWALIANHPEKDRLADAIRARGAALGLA